MRQLLSINARQLTLLALLAALALSWSGCKKKAEKPIVAGPAPTGPVELKLKWPADRHVTQTLEVKQIVETFIPNLPTPMKQDINMEQTFTLTVLKEEPDGGHQLEMEFVSSRMTLAAGNQTLKVDSKDKSSLTNPVAQALMKLDGTRLRFFLDASNEVWRIEGMDEFKKRMAEGPKDPTGLVNSMFTEDYFKQLMSQNKSLPPGPVAPGDTWPVQMEYSMGQMGTLVMDFKYTFKEWERRNDHNCARIEYTGTLKTKPGQSLHVNSMNMVLEGGKSTGETYFDLEGGMFVAGTMDQDMTLFLTLPNVRRGNTPGPARPQVVTNTLNQVITFNAQARK